MITMRTLLMVTSLAMAATILVGCNRPLFPPNTPRSQYDRYSALRGQQRVGTEVRRPGGPEEIVLRERLRPLE